jgi:hypothetical protein
MNERSPFSLSKWYMDCVADDGTAFVGYHARLRWRRLTIHYASILEHRDGATRSATSLRRGAAPTVGDGSVGWSCDRLGVEARWTGTAPAVRRTLLRSERGAIEWHCVHPHARAEVSIRGERMSGLGYVEHLSMTLPPWRVPIDELRWGRFLSDEGSLVWIDWRGPSPLTLVFRDGVSVGGATVADTHVALEGGAATLAFDDRHVLREGALVTTALAEVPGVRSLFPVRSLQTFERKWRSRGELTGRPGAREIGWAIHEVVRFAGPPPAGA